MHADSCSSHRGGAIALRADSGTLTIHMILHAIGEERYQIAEEHGELTLNTVFEYSDRGNKRTTTATLRTKSDYTPLDLEVKDRPMSVHVEGPSATVKEGDTVRTFARPANYFTIFGPSPFAVQMMMLRYWKAHGQPRSLPMLRAKPGAEPVQIESVGHDDIGVPGKPGPAGSLHGREPDVRPGNPVDERARRSGRGDDVRRRLADGGGSH